MCLRKGVRSTSVSLPDGTHEVVWACRYCDSVIPDEDPRPVRLEQEAPARPRCSGTGVGDCSQFLSGAFRTGEDPPVVWGTCWIHGPVKALTDDETPVGEVDSLTRMELVTGIGGGLAHLREPESLTSLCGRSAAWVAAPERLRLCRHCREIREERDAHA
jgi:hypothetical protein